MHRRMPSAWARRRCTGSGRGTCRRHNSRTPLPLVLFDAPCLLRSAATRALDAANIPWRIALTSPSVGGLWAAVAGGLGVTLRTRIGLPGNLRVIDGLPPMPTLGYVLHAGAELQAPAIKHLAGLIETGLQEQAQGLAP